MVGRRRKGRMGGTAPGRAGRPATSEGSVRTIRPMTIKECEREVLKSPNDPTAHWNMANALSALGHTEEAMGHIERMTEIDSGDARAWARLGVIYGALGRHEEALGACERALGADPLHAGAHMTKIMALQRLGRHGEDLAGLMRAVEAEPDDALARISLGIALAAAGRLEEGAGCLRRAAEMIPDNVDILLNLGRMLSPLGRHEEAIAALRRVVELEPRGPHYRTALAEALAAAGRTGGKREPWARGEPDVSRRSRTQGTRKLTACCGAASGMARRFQWRPQAVQARRHPGSSSGTGLATLPDKDGQVGRSCRL